jgi:lipopolysaccharide/colanic/teichoic acid biosynthesis glycosyltransferase
VAAVAGEAGPGAGAAGGDPLAPLLVALALAIAVVDRQRPLVGLGRVGRHGRRFTLWKLRTMRTGPGHDQAFTVQDDARVTPLGRRLRRYRLDELPQLWNVIRGDMALLGPRPEAIENVDEAAAWAGVLTTPPGIAGPTQLVIHGWESRLTTIEQYRMEVLPHKLVVDGWYVAEASPAVDLDVVRSLLRSVRDPDADTAVHRRVRVALPSTMDAIAAGAAS